MKFLRPEMLFLLWAVPALLLLYLHAAARRKRILTGFASEAAGPAINPDQSTGRRWMKAVLVLAGLGLSAAALSGPQYGYSWQTIERRGVSLIVALDCSKSMLAEDVKPSRLERAKREVYDLLNMLEGDKIGLTAFAGTAYLHCPLTLDYGAFQLFLSALGPDHLPMGGTDLSGAVYTALGAFDPEDGTEKAVILITDGEATTAGAVDAARAAAERGVKLFCIGVGSREGSPFNDGESGLKKDAEGNIVISRLDEQTLMDMAAAAGGRYVRSVTGDMDLEAIYQKEIRGKMEAAELGGGRKQLHIDRYRWLLGLAVFLLLAEMLISAARRTAVLLLVCFLLGTAPAAWASDSRSMTARGIEAFERGDFQAALEAFRQARVVDPDNPVLDFNLGDAHYQLKEYDAARESFEKAAESPDPSLRAKAYYNLGNTDFRRGDLPGAVKNYETALEIAPDDEDARRNLDFVKELMERMPPQSQPGDGKDESKKKPEEDQPKPSPSEDGEKKDDEAGGDEPERGDQPKPPDDNGNKPDETDRPASSDSEPEPSGGEQDDEPSRAPGGENEPAPESGRPEAERSVDENMLNRLKDRPGYVTEPKYEDRNVEMDW